MNNKTKGNPSVTPIDDFNWSVLHLELQEEMIS